ncbi:hypothetical protein AK830_g6150 [Neonectria ditissima]|uniref:Protein kinase domain-containing protein n=1 Tax=Neonectria ditissima TaxID=78410 RepID=A0A0P7BJ85_9HYPO|nr:hypothetical protein AK830_g6150 [Neonectria ditissima]
MIPNYLSPYYETLRGDDDLSMEPYRPEGKPNPPPQSSRPKDPKPACPIAKTITKFLPDDLFHKGLAKFLPQPNDPLMNKKILLDAVFPAISQLLVDHGKFEWSLRPRTFALLWMLGVPDKMDTFVAEGRTDHYLPYSEGNLPDIIKGSSQRSSFLNLQSVVRCRREEDLSGLEEGGHHVHLPGHADAYFHSLEVLGTGRFAQVDKVYSRRTLKTYALKQIHRGQSVLEDKFQLASFEKELQSLKAISHRHVVKLVGSYTDSTALGLIMCPVANMDLHQYLNSVDVDPDLRKKSLRSFFGCLVTALAYIHQKNIRHKDIKPNNVLVKGGQVLLADFGTSRICLDGHLTTNGESKEGTPRYWAPEVMEGADRNTASDIWSLGCVFLEMATTLFGYTHSEMLAFYSQNGTENYRTICLNAPATRLWVAKLRGSGAAFDSPVLDWTEWMLQEKPNDRPTAAQVRGRILDTETEFEYICHHCALSNGFEHSESLDSGTMMTASPPAGVRRQLLDSTEAESSSDNPEAVDSESVSESTGSSTLLDHQLLDPDDQRSQEPLTKAEQDTATDNEAKEVVKESPAPPTPELIIVEPERVEPEKPYKRHVTFATEDDIEVIELDSEAESVEEIQSERFIGLAEDQRPLPSSSSEIDPDDIFNKDEAFIAPEAIKPPPFHHRDCLPLPEASLVPSYILAGTNHLSQREMHDSRRSAATSNIFVYGRLMFPSVLHAVAARATEGAYSPGLQRRLVLNSDDWAKANLSVQRATELMTPARLSGYMRWKPEGFDCAVIQKSFEPHQSQDGVVGFLISGVTREALRYFDLLFASTERNLDKMRPESSDERFRDQSDTESLLQRQSVDVQVELNTGEITTVHAHTYVWRYPPINPTKFVDGKPVKTYDPQWRYGDANTPWDESEFVDGRLFQGMLNAQLSARREEQALATRMKMSYALVGDILCRAILAGDVRELTRLLKTRQDPNALCRVYGSPLQASIAVGNEDMVQLLLDNKADVNAKGGRYGTPLIAAAFASRKAITRLLLRKGADVFATHPMHVNALYQAIGHSDYAIAEMLLEHAAWLVEDWGEVCDLAEETGDTEIESLLRAYDVREIHRRYLLARPGKRFVSIADRPSYRTIAGAVLRKGMAVQGMSGNWKGRKGVAVMVAALNAGASIEVIPLLRRTVGPLKAVVDALKEGDRIEELKYRKALESGDLYSDAEDWSASEGEDTPGESEDEYQERKRRPDREKEKEGDRERKKEKEYDREIKKGTGRREEGRTRESSPPRRR